MELTGKRICIIVENLPVPFDRRVWQEALTLREAGAEVSVICPAGRDASRSYECLEGVRIYRHHLPVEGNGPVGYLREYFAAFRNQRRLLKQAWNDVNGFDAIQICNPPDLLYLNARPYKKKYATKIVFDHHDINPELFLAKFGRKNIYYYLLLHFESRTFACCDHSIATNESYRQVALNRGRMNESCVTVVRSAPKLDRLERRPPEPSLKKGKTLTIGYVGVIGQQEGIDHLLEAIRYLIDLHQYSDFHCYVCGDGPARQAMQDYCSKLRLDNYVTFTGRISDDELLSILNTADVCVNPDVPNEMNDKSTMNKIMEYMALGKPIVQYDLTEGRYSAQDSSLYVTPNSREEFAEAILRLASDVELRAEMGKRGIERVMSELNWSVESPKYRSVYVELLS